MNLTLQLTGIANELAHKEKLILEIVNPSALKEKILEEIPGLRNYHFEISVNGHLSKDYSSLSENDCILVFSPYAGG